MTALRAGAPDARPDPQARWAPLTAMTRRSEATPSTHRLWPPRRWPVGWLAVAVWLAGYVALTALWTVAGRMIVAASSGPPRELAADQWFAARRQPDLDLVSGWISRSGDAVTKLVVIALLVGLFMALWRRLDEAVLLVAVMSVEVSAFVTTTALVGRARPDVVRLDGALPTSSYPSGHVAAATALYLTIAAVTWLRARRPLAALVTLTAVTGVVLMALSRLYRGMHYPSDVTAGAALGLASIGVGACVLVAGRRAMERRTAPPPPVDPDPESEREWRPHLAATGEATMVSLEAQPDLAAFRAAQPDLAPYGEVRP